MIITLSIRKPISRVSFTLTAKEDIKTADNNGYAYRAGDVVAEFTTGVTEAL